MFRFVVRPKGILTTPKLLRDALHARSTRVYPGRRSSLGFSPERDFFLCYPPIAEPTPEYTELRQFYCATKYTQRVLLRMGAIPTVSVRRLRTSAPDAEPDLRSSDEFVVRPLRHRSGIGYRVTFDPNDFEEGREYISRLYPKRHEYRVIFCFGTPLITLLKRVPEGIDPNGPWNHANGSTFITVNNPDNNRLRHTDCIERLSAFSVVKNAHLVAADIMLGDNHDYVVSELNFCPALTIENNLRKVASHALSTR